MNEIIRAELEELAELILEQTRKLIAYGTGAPQIEVDITKESIRKLYDQLDFLVNPNWKASKDQNLEKAIDDQVDELLNAAAVQFNDDLQQIEQQILEQEEIIEEQANIQKEDIEVLEENVEIQELSNTHKKEENIIITSESDEHYAIEPKIESKEKIDKSYFREEKSTENNSKPIVDSKPGESKIVGEHLNKKPISSLKSAIGINDKFQFINELFDGSMKTFNQAITQFDKASDHKAAMYLFNKTASKHNWDEESQAYAQLLNYLDRRFR